MIKTDKVIVVEGKYDKIKLSSVIDAIIIPTDGFGIFKDKEKQKMLRRLAQSNGLIVMTDSDSAGFKIRSFLGSIVGKDYITNIYIPDIYGKEKRKDAPSKEGKLGVEGVDIQIIEHAFEQAGIGFSQSEKKDIAEVTLNDFYSDGLTGGADSKNKRKRLLKYLDLPEECQPKRCLK